MAKPVRVDIPTDDISPLHIRHMAGNGREFTRTIMDGPSELSEDTEFKLLSDGVYVRGQSQIYADGHPLSYSVMEENNKNTIDQHWGYDFAPTDDTSFRVVLEIPKASKTQTEKPPKEQK